MTFARRPASTTLTGLEGKVAGVGGQEEENAINGGASPIRVQSFRVGSLTWVSWECSELVV